MVVAQVFRFAGDVLQRTFVADRFVNVVGRVDAEELGRRQLERVDPVRDFDVLRELARLPFGYGIKADDLDPFSVTLLRTLPAGIVEWDHETVTRVWKPALSMTGFFVVTGDWRRGLRRVSLFAADAPRALVYTGSSRLSGVVEKADVVGVGVGVPSENGVSILLEPDRSLARADIAQWALSEELLSKYLSAA